MNSKIHESKRMETVFSAYTVNKYRQIVTRSKRHAHDVDSCAGSIKSSHERKELVEIVDMKSQDTGRDKLKCVDLVGKIVKEMNDSKVEMGRMCNKDSRKNGESKYGLRSISRAKGLKNCVATSDISTPEVNLMEKESHRYATAPTATIKMKFKREMNNEKLMQKGMVDEYSVKTEIYLMEKDKKSNSEPRIACPNSNVEEFKPFGRFPDLSNNIVDPQTNFTHKNRDCCENQKKCHSASQESKHNIGVVQKDLGQCFDCQNDLEFECSKLKSHCSYGHIDDGLYGTEYDRQKCLRSIDQSVLIRLSPNKDNKSERKDFQPKLDEKLGSHDNKYTCNKYNGERVKRTTTCLEKQLVQNNSDMIDFSDKVTDKQKCDFVASDVMVSLDIVKTDNCPISMKDSKFTRMCKYGNKNNKKKSDKLAKYGQSKKSIENSFNGNLKSQLSFATKSKNINVLDGEARKKSSHAVENVTMEHKKSKTEIKVHHMMSSNLSKGTCESPYVTSILNNRKSDCEIQYVDKCPVGQRKRISDRLLLAKRQPNEFKRTIRSRSLDCNLYDNISEGANMSSLDGSTKNLQKQTSFEIKQAEDGSFMVVDKSESKWIYRNNICLPQKLACNEELFDDRRRRPIVVLRDVMEEKKDRSNNTAETNGNAFSQKIHQNSYLLPDGEKCDKKAMEPMPKLASMSHVVGSQNSLYLRKRKSKDNPLKFSLRIKKKKLDEMKGRSQEKSILRQYLSSCQNEKMPTNLNFEHRFSKSYDSKYSRGFDQTRYQNDMRNSSQKHLYKDSLQMSVIKRDKSKSKGMCTTYSYIGVKDNQLCQSRKKKDKISENTEATLKADVDSSTRTENCKASANGEKFHDSDSETEDYVLSETDDIDDQEIYGIDHSSNTSYRDTNNEGIHYIADESDSKTKRCETRKSFEDDGKRPFRTENSAVWANTEEDTEKISWKTEEDEVGIGNVTNVKGISKSQDFDWKKYGSSNDKENSLILSCEIKENKNPNKRACSEHLEISNHAENRTKDSIIYKVKNQKVEYEVKDKNVEYNIKDSKTEYKAKYSSAEYKTEVPMVEYKAKDLNTKYDTKDSNVKKETQNSKFEIKPNDSKIKKNIKDLIAENKTKDSKFGSKTNDPKMEYKAIESIAENEPKDLKAGYKAKDTTTEYKAKYSKAEYKPQDQKVEQESNAEYKGKNPKVESKTKDSKIDSKTNDSKIEYKAVEPNTNVCKYHKDVNQAKDSTIEYKTHNPKVKVKFQDLNAKDNSKDSKVDVETEDSKIGNKIKDLKIENKSKDSNADNKTKDTKVEDKAKDLNAEYKAKDTKVKNKSKASDVESKTKGFKIEYKAVDSNDENEPKDTKVGYKAKDSNYENKIEESKLGYKTNDSQIVDEVKDKLKVTKVKYAKASKKIDHELISSKIEEHKGTELSRTEGYRTCEIKQNDRESVSQIANHEIITNKENLLKVATADLHIIKHKENEDCKVLENMKRTFENNSQESYKTVGYRVLKDDENFIEKTICINSSEKLKNSENLCERIFAVDSGIRRSDWNNHEEVSKTKMKNKKKKVNSKKEKRRIGKKMCKAEKGKGSKKKNQNTTTKIDDLKKALSNEKGNNSNLKKTEDEYPYIIANKGEKRKAVNVSVVKEEKSNRTGLLQKCEHCETSLQTLAELKAHKKASHKKINKNKKVLPKKEKVSSHKGTPHICQQCETSFETLTKLKAHRRTNHPNTCGKCGLVFFDKATRMQHFWTHFNHIFTCTQCDSKFISEKLFQNHLKSLTHAKVAACIAVKNRQKELERKEEELIQAVASIQESSAQGDHSRTFTWTSWMNDTDDDNKSLETTNTGICNLYHSMDSHMIYGGNVINCNNPNVVTYLDQNVGTSYGESIETFDQKDWVQEELDTGICNNSTVDLSQHPHDMASYTNILGCHSNSLEQLQNEQFEFETNVSETQLQNYAFESVQQCIWKPEYQDNRIIQSLLPAQNMEAVPTESQLQFTEL